MINRKQKLLNMILRNTIKPIAYLNNDLYMKLYNRYLKYIGVTLDGTPLYIHPTVYFDGSDYSLIHIGEGSSISKNVSFLTHDFSMNTVYKGLNLEREKEFDVQYSKNRLRVLKEIIIGEHTFIGANCFILPGSKIGSNCIIGAGSVIRGIIPDDSIVIGNPAKVVKKTSEWLNKKNFESEEFR